jgi:hypothetical protein
MAIPQVQPVLHSLEFGRKRFIYGMERVPDDRLNWSPGGSAPTPLAVAGKLENFAAFIAYMIPNRTIPPGERPAYTPPADRQAAIASLERAFGRLRDTLAGVTEEQLGLEAPAPWAEMITVGGWVVIVPQFVAYFQGQLNLIQLAYGDEDPNMPPEYQRHRG